VSESQRKEIQKHKDIFNRRDQSKAGNNNDKMWKQF
jgi:hypothetical protein